MLKKLTARAVETAKADGKRLEIRDENVSGLELRVSSQGGKSWALRYRRLSDSKKQTATLGNFPAYSLDDARQWALDLKREISRGADPAAQRKAWRQADTFEELSDDWLKLHAEPNKSPRAVADDRSMLAMHILPAIGSMKAGEVRKSDVIRLLDETAAKHDARTAGTANPRRMTHRPNRVHVLVKSIFRWAVARDALTIDPTNGLTPPIKKERPRERELSPDEIKRLWDALDRAPIVKRSTKDLPRGERAAGDADLRMTRAVALMMRLALATGQRIGEIASIAHADIDRNSVAPVWTIPGRRSKNGETHRVPLSPLALRIIGEADQWSFCKTWLFPASAGGVALKGGNVPRPVDAHTASKALERSRKALGLEPFRIHDLRRTAATRMAEMGVNPHTISLILNHASARRGNITAKVYDRYSYDREKRDALNAWGERLARIVAGTDAANVVPFPASAAAPA